jgi:hypothetical protein
MLVFDEQVPVPVFRSSCTVHTVISVSGQSRISYDKDLKTSDIRNSDAIMIYGQHVSKRKTAFYLSDVGEWASVRIYVDV